MPYGIKFEDGGYLDKSMKKNLDISEIMTFSKPFEARMVQFRYEDELMRTGGKLLLERNTMFVVQLEIKEIG